MELQWVSDQILMQVRFHSAGNKHGPKLDVICWLSTHSEIDVWLRIISFGRVHFRINHNWVQSPGWRLKGLWDIAFYRPRTLVRALMLLFCVCAKGSVTAIPSCCGCRQMLCFGFVLLRQDWQLPFPSDSTVKTGKNPHGDNRDPEESFHPATEPAVVSFHSAYGW